MKDWYELTNDLDTSVPPLDEVTQARILNRVKTALPRRKRRFSLAAVIAAALLLTACGAAVVTGQFSDWFWNLSQDVRAPEESQDLFAELGTVIGQSQTVGNVTMTLDGALWDGEHIYLSLLVEGLEKKYSYGTYVGFGDSWLSGSKEAAWEQAKEKYPEVTEEQFAQYWEYSLFARRPDMDYVYNRETDAYRLQVHQSLSSESAAELTLHLENLELNAETIEGPFEFTFTAQPKDMTQVYTGDVVYQQEGVPDIRISEVRVRPFEVEMDFTTVDPGEQVDHKDMKIGTLMAGGKETIGSSRGGFGTATDESGHTDYTLRDGPFRQVVDPRTVTAIGINGGWLELDQFTLQE